MLGGRCTFAALVAARGDSAKTMPWLSARKVKSPGATVWRRFWGDGLAMTEPNGSCGYATASVTADAVASSTDPSRDDPPDGVLLASRCVAPSRALVEDVKSTRLGTGAVAGAVMFGLIDVCLGGVAKCVPAATLAGSSEYSRCGVRRIDFTGDARSKLSLARSPETIDLPGVVGSAEACSGMEILAGDLASSGMED